MNLKGLTLEEWLLKKTPKKGFPNYGEEYPTMYKRTADHLYNNVHSEVNTGALLNDGLLLTDHGPGHIKTVIERASALVKADSCVLTVYEVFLLLSAIHLHDVGNIYGRENHETRSREVLKHLGKLATTDDVERKIIYNIAESHGGKQKDKLEYLPETDLVLGFDVRVRLLAAILKFADELADDYSRATRQPWHQVPHRSQIFQKFAEKLKTVKVDHDTRTVYLHFSINKEDALQKFGKSDDPTDDVYIIDEIYKRTYRTHLERVYCMRFTNPLIRLDTISVKIEFFDEDYDEVREPIGYRLEEKGYPSDNPNGFKAICPEIKCNGESIRREIERGKNRKENRK